MSPPPPEMPAARAFLIALLLLLALGWALDAASRGREGFSAAGPRVPMPDGAASCADACASAGYPGGSRGGRRVHEGGAASCECVPETDAAALERTVRRVESSGPTAWTCVPGIPTPVRMSEGSEVQCMSPDGRGCMWQGGDSQCRELAADPGRQGRSALECGRMHASIYGGTGYEPPGHHWCARARRHLQDASAAKQLL